MNKRIESLRLVPLTLEDCASIFELFSNFKVLSAYVDQPIKTRFETIDFVKRITSNGSWTWKIIDPHSKNSIIGICSLHNLDTIKKTIQIGGTLFPQYWGMGYMSWAFINVFKIISQKYEVNYIVCKTTPSNVRAIGLAKKLGFEIQDLSQNEVVLVKNLHNII